MILHILEKDLRRKHQRLESSYILLSDQYKNETPAKRRKTKQCETSKAE